MRPYWMATILMGKQNFILKGVASMETSKITFTENELCAQIGISRVTAWRLRNAGKLPHARVGRKVFYTLQHIEQFIKSVEVPLNPTPTGYQDESYR
jgi:predicted DNA-binding transcriptional regulator AlpA